MEAIALLLEASEVHAKAEAKYASAMDVADAEEANRDFEAISAILNLKDALTHNLDGSRTPEFNRSSSSMLDERPERRRRAMSEPWVTMSPSYSRPTTRHNGAHVAGSTKAMLSAANQVYYHPQILQPRFPTPLLAPFQKTLQSGSSSPQDPARVPTMEEFAAIANKNGRIGIYTKEEREVLIRRFRDKKKRRVWRKQIRYECRKDLAERRCRVKGRFVKAAGSMDSQGSGPMVLLAASGSLGSEQSTTSSEASSLVISTGNQPRGNPAQQRVRSDSGSSGLFFRLPSRPTPMAAAARLQSGNESNPRKRMVQPLALEAHTTPEDRLKYLASILDEVEPTVTVSSPEVHDDEEGEDDEEDDDEDMDVDDEGELRDRFAADAVPSSSAHADEGRGRKRSDSESSTYDYRRVRRHSIAY